MALCMIRAVFVFLTGISVVFFTGDRAAYAQKKRQPPFYASTRSDLINVRTGPGVRYPIRWVYKRNYWPVEVVTVFEDWYKIRDTSGVAGWAHKSLISGKRYVVAEGDQPQPVLKQPDPHAAPVFMIEPGATASLENCNAGWCLIRAEGYEGWAEQTILWGAR